MTATWNATPADVERVIGAALCHASADSTLPVINVVRLELLGDRLLAIGTDRYSLAVVRASLKDWDSEAKRIRLPQTGSISVADVKRLFAFLRPQRTKSARWTLKKDELTVLAGDGSEITVPTADAEHFPDWRVIARGVLGREPDPGAQMAFTPRVVDHFHRSAKVLGEQRMSWQFVSHLKPVVVRIGTDFLGMLMPCRISDDMPALDAGAFGIETPKAVTA
jgi:hypothetical protein